MGSFQGKVKVSTKINCEINVGAVDGVKKNIVRRKVMGICAYAKDLDDGFNKDDFGWSNGLLQQFHAWLQTDR